MQRDESHRCSLLLRRREGDIENVRHPTDPRYLTPPRRLAYLYKSEKGRTVLDTIKLLKENENENQKLIILLFQTIIVRNAQLL